MKTTTITDAKNGLSALIDRVKAGDSVLILDRGVPVARLEPVPSNMDPSGRLRRLERSGVIRPGSAAPPIELLRTPPPVPAANASAIDALLDDRRSGR